jgi:hypothetical protein
MYNYDPSIFDDLTLPPEIDKQLFIDNLLMRSGEFELLYPDAGFLKPAINVWGRKWYPTFEKWIEGQKATWNPIENYDRYEESNDHTVSSGSGSDTTNVSGGGSNEHTVSVYDSSTYQPADKNENSSSSESSSSTNTSGEATKDFNSHIHGNIGVTQAADMLRNFYDIAGWNILEHMADVFIREFMITTY